ncbi:uncharacterized protein LOC143183013 [Calliopsis andreniformis]|uniref:uncharacterized protein LOC143183013 n=1 Tax=Calliopsis andreniformis TaxID=337506 RepID=UPI003FCED706
MKTTNWVCWLLVVCICLVEARYKIRRPPAAAPQPPKLMFKKWPITHRISVGHTMHMNGNLPPKRMLHKPPNYRIRRPPMFNVPSVIWKNQIPIRTPMNNHVVLPQRPPVKEFHSVNKMPEYSPEYRPEAAVLPPTHRGGVDDDKGPIHTIPAPNLSPMDKPLNSETNMEETPHRQQTTDATFKINPHGSLLLPNFDIATISTSLAPQKAVTSPTPIQHQYEVTESNDIGQREYQTVLPTFLPPEFATGLTTIVNHDLQSNDVFLNNHPGTNMGLIGTNIQFGQPNLPMQTNLHSSLHVGFPGTAGQTPYIINQQIPDLHVGHPAPAGPPLSATQLYDLLNSFPQKVPEQYQTGQQPQLQQHILQQQLGQFFQPTGVTGFSQPQMQSFNYNEQDNKEQQQQVVFNHNYVAGKVNTNYNVEAEASVEDQEANNLQQNEDLAYITDGSEQLENNLEYDEPSDQNSQTTYFDKVPDNDGISTQFYTTLPNREAAEKLAALAAAGNVNSQLIGQLRKHQQHQQNQQNQQHQEQQETASNEEPMPPNHKHEDQKSSDDDRYETDRTQNRQKQRNPQQEQYEEQQKAYDRQQHRQRQSSVYSNKRPLRIMVPDENEYGNTESQNDEGKESAEMEYEYENEGTDVTNSQSNDSFDGRTSYEQSNAEFGSRLSPKAAA